MKNPVLLRQKLEGLTEIRANEQSIGHLQITVQDILREMLDELEKTQKAVGIYK